MTYLHLHIKLTITNEYIFQLIQKKSGVGKVYIFKFWGGQSLMFKEKRIERRKDNIIINMGNQPKPRILESKIIRLLYIFFSCSGTSYFVVEKFILSSV